MLKTRTLYLMTALLLGLAALEPSSAESQKLSVQEPALSLASRRTIGLRAGTTYRWRTSTSGTTRRRRPAEALAKSLDYYRMALAKETTTPISEFGQGLGDDEGMREIRARFGCPGVTAYWTQPGTGRPKGRPVLRHRPAHFRDLVPVSRCAGSIFGIT